MANARECQPDFDPQKKAMMGLSNKELEGANKIKC